MIINYDGKTLHYYKYKDTMIIDRGELCNILDPDHSTSLTQKISLTLDKPTEQLSINKPEFELVEGLVADVTNQFRSMVSFVTVAGLQRLLDKKAPFAKRIYDDGAAKWLFSLFLSPVPVEEPTLPVQETISYEEIACVEQIKKENVIKFEDIAINLGVPEENKVILINKLPEKIIMEDVSTIAEYILSPDIIKAVRLRAVNEDKLEDDVVEEILRANLEPKYFNL